MIPYRSFHIEPGTFNIFHNGNQVFQYIPVFNLAQAKNLIDQSMSHTPPVRSPRIGGTQCELENGSAERDRMTEQAEHHAMMQEDSAW